MTLKPLLVGLVPDITIVPVNLSYDRVLEEVLFAYELLGVPKPKETTKGFVKALSILKENYGNIYIQFGEPISVKKYFIQKIDPSAHSLDSIEMQDLTPDETKWIINLAHKIIRRQKELTSLSCFNLIAAVVNDYLFKQPDSLYLDNIVLEVQWLCSVLRVLAENAVSTLNSVTTETVLHHLNLHKALLHLSEDKKIQLSRIHSINCVTDSKNLKGHELSNSTMDIAVPTLMLQCYVNPCSSFLIGVCFIALIVHLKKRLISSDEILEDFKFFCSIFSFEFIFHNDFFHEDFTKAINDSKCLKIIHLTKENNVEVGENNKLQGFCVNFLGSYIPAYVNIIEILLESAGLALTEKQILKTCQQKLESKLTEGFAIHPANLSLNLFANSLQALVSMKAVYKRRSENGFRYRVDLNELKIIYSKLSQGIPDPCVSDLEISSYGNPKHFKQHLHKLLHADYFKMDFKEEPCYCCQKKYLFECPDNCNTKSRSCSCNDGNRRNTPVIDCSEKCRCDEILRNRVLKNYNINQRRKQISKGDSKYDLSSADDENQNPFGENIQNRKIFKGRVTEKSDLANEKFKFNNRHKAAAGENLRICFCPCIRDSYMKNQEKSFSEPIKSASKLVQVELEPIKISKTVQTNPETAPQPKRERVCFHCRSRFDASEAKGCPASNFCVPTNCTQNPAFLSPCSLGNHFKIHKSCSGEVRKKHNKKMCNKKEDSEEESKVEAKLNRRLLREAEQASKHFVKRPLKEQKREKIWEFMHITEPESTSHYPGIKIFDPFRYLTKYEPKSRLLREVSPKKLKDKYLSPKLSSKPMNLAKGDAPFYSTKPFRNQIYNQKAFYHSTRPSELSVAYLERNDFLKNSNPCDQATMTVDQKTETSEADVLENEKFPKETAGSANSEVQVSTKKPSTKFLKKRRRLLGNRKRRRKLTGQISFQEYGKFFEELAKRLAVSNKQSQIEEIDQNYIRSKNVSSSSPRDLQCDENSNVIFRNAISGSRETLTETFRKIEKEMSNKRFPENAVLDESPGSQIKLEPQLGKNFKKMSCIGGNSWSSSTLKVMVDEILAKNKSKELKLLIL